MSEEKSLFDLLVEDNATPRKVMLMGRAVYVTQMTLADQAKVTAMFPDGSVIETPKRQAAALILKCRDADGKPLFTSDQRDGLANLPGANKFDAVWAALNGNTVDEQAEK
jgi:hypothetical protein